MDRQTRIRISKQISYLLRHAPQSADLPIAPGGWVPVEPLLDYLSQQGHDLSRQELDRLAADDPKRRFGFSDDGRFIRAHYGHSVEVDLQYAPQEPPDILYHGTAVDVLPKIMAEGIVRRRRQYVHLSEKTDMARQVGSRHGKPRIVIVEAPQMHRAGHIFYRSESGIWLTDHVPPEFLRPAPQ